MGEDEHQLSEILLVATSVLDEWSLRVNEQKTEYVKVYIAGKEETDMHIAWCKSC